MPPKHSDQQVLHQELLRLKETRKALKAELREQSKEHRNLTARRKRLLQATKNLSNEDLQLLLRAREGVVAADPNGPVLADNAGGGGAAEHGGVVAAGGQIPEDAVREPCAQPL
mmetsp:Transcript_29348/g.61296  ORF Transcript_29348/g.61296 Transcript_29348/m.61296 type:complete len:114 (-) Transcript_29348:424-765(-)